MRQLKGFLDSNWHYTDRLKSEESYAQKVEAGRCKPNLQVDDLFACTVVVRNSTEIKLATKAIEQQFNVLDRRPAHPDRTKNRPSEFQFDDLRLYATLKPSLKGARPIDNVVFEVQVKTFLQHAWGIATHDLTYKTDKVRWGKLRLASQIRAMLDHAELSIEQFNTLAESPIIAKQHEEYDDIDRLIAFIREFWDPAALPKDLQRLAQTVRSAAVRLGVSVDQVMDYVRVESDAGRGTNSFDLSPYGVILQAILSNHLIDKTRLRRGTRDKIMVPSSVDIPAAISELIGPVFRVY